MLQAFGLVCSSSSNSHYDGKFAYVPALEDVLVWNMKKGQTVCRLALNILSLCSCNVHHSSQCGMRPGIEQKSHAFYARRRRIHLLLDTPTVPFDCGVPPLRRSSRHSTDIRRLSLHWHSMQQAPDSRRVRKIRTSFFGMLSAKLDFTGKSFPLQLHLEPTIRPVCEDTETKSLLYGSSVQWPNLHLQRPLVSLLGFS